jgi:hypothetical protein
MSWHYEMGWEGVGPNSNKFYGLMKCPVDKMSSWQNCPFDKMSSWQNVPASWDGFKRSGT